VVVHLQRPLGGGERGVEGLGVGLGLPVDHSQHGGVGPPGVRVGEARVELATARQETLRLEVVLGGEPEEVGDPHVEQVPRAQVGGRAATHPVPLRVPDLGLDRGGDHLGDLVEDVDRSSTVRSYRRPTTTPRRSSPSGWR
jgi:hypothetical protein